MNACRKIDVNTRPVNINAASVALNTNASASGAPIELQAGASWACLDADGARRVIRDLTSALAALTDTKG